MGVSNPPLEIPVNEQPNQPMLAIEQLCRLGYVNGAGHLALIRQEYEALKLLHKRLVNTSNALVQAQRETHVLLNSVGAQTEGIWRAAQEASDTGRPFENVWLERKEKAETAATGRHKEGPKYERGAVLRFEPGSTAFFQVQAHALDLLNGGWSYIGRHIMVGGPLVGPIPEEQCAPITEDERHALKSMGGGTHIGVRDGVL